MRRTFAMNVKPAFGILSVLFFGMAWPTDAPSALAHGPARGSSGCVDDTWMATRTDTAPGARLRHTAVWTGSEMIVWGGFGSCLLTCNIGGRYDPTTDTCVATRLASAPSTRAGRTAVWTGTAMTVWGGDGGGNTGGRYDPTTDTWKPTSLVNAPSP